MEKIQDFLFLWRQEQQQKPLQKDYVILNISIANILRGHRWQLNMEVFYIIIYIQFYSIWGELKKKYISKINILSIFTLLMPSKYRLFAVLNCVLANHHI